jgi:hypothetical protein
LRTVPSAEDAARSGRPRKTDSLADGAIVRAAELDPFASNREIRGRLRLAVSETTISRRLSAAGLPSHFAAQKRHYTDEQRRQRLSFAHGYKNWTAEQWERVIFSDEVTIEGEGRKCQIRGRVRPPEGHRFDPEYMLHSRIFTPSRHLAKVSATTRAASSTRVQTRSQAIITLIWSCAYAQFTTSPS